jgi:hypothetical protein
MYGKHGVTPIGQKKQDTRRMHDKIWWLFQNVVIVYYKNGVMDIPDTENKIKGIK